MREAPPRANARRCPPPALSASAISRGPSRRSGCTRRARRLSSSLKGASWRDTRAFATCVDAPISTSVTAAPISSILITLRNRSVLPPEVSGGCKQA